MSQEHVWSCGKCGARVVAKVGAIMRTFKAHVLTCPALPRRQNRPPDTTTRPAPPTPPIAPDALGPNPVS